MLRQSVNCYKSDVYSLIKNQTSASAETYPDGYCVVIQSLQIKKWDVHNEHRGRAEARAAGERWRHDFSMKMIVS